MWRLTQQIVSCRARHTFQFFPKSMEGAEGRSGEPRDALHVPQTSPSAWQCPAKGYGQESRVGRDCPRKKARNRAGEQENFPVDPKLNIWALKQRDQLWFRRLAGMQIASCRESPDPALRTFKVSGEPKTWLKMPRSSDSTELNSTTDEVALASPFSE